MVEDDGDTDDEVALVPTDGTRFEILFLRVPEEKVGQNRLHLDLTSASIEDQQASVETLLDSAPATSTSVSVRRRTHVVLADPEGNELCIIGPDNNFLADCARLGAISCDGSRDVGYFWSAALGWPLVWDQDEETAIRATGRHRSDHQLGWTATHAEDAEEPSAPRHRAAGRRRPGVRGRAADRPRRHLRRHRPGRRHLGGHGRPGRQRVLRADARGSAAPLWYADLGIGQGLSLDSACITVFAVGGSAMIIGAGVVMPLSA